MANPQQSELRRSEQNEALSPDATEGRVGARRRRRTADDGLGPVPDANRPGHHDDEEQDRPDLDAFAERLGIVHEGDEPDDAGAAAAGGRAGTTGPSRGRRSSGGPRRSGTEPERSGATTSSRSRRRSDAVAGPTTTDDADRVGPPAATVAGISADPVTDRARVLALVPRPPAVPAPLVLARVATTAVLGPWIVAGRMAEEARRRIDRAAAQHLRAGPVLDPGTAPTGPPV